MSLKLVEFLQLAVRCPPFGVAVLLAVGMVLVNGGTDAPNAIAGCMASHAMRPRSATWMAAACNLLGALAATLRPAVAETIADLANFGNGATAVAGLCAGMTAVVVWSAGAWLLGIPTSESHALIAGLSGAAMAVHRGVAGIRWAPWAKTLIGLAVSTVPAFATGFAAERLLARVVRRADRRKTAGAFRRVQIVSGAAMAFAHGMQDGQKFVGVLLLAAGQVACVSRAPLWMSVMVAGLMAAGTAMGGRRVVQTIGIRMARPEPCEVVAADASAALLLSGAAALGIPVSTTHGKTTALMGASAGRRLRAVNWRVAGEMAWAWLLTFPGCGALGYLAARIFLNMG